MWNIFQKKKKKKIKSLDEIFKTTDFNEKFASRIEALSNKQSQEKLSEFIKDIIKEIDKNTLSMKILKNNLRSSNQILKTLMK